MSIGPFDSVSGVSYAAHKRLSMGISASHSAHCPLPMQHHMPAPFISSQMSYTTVSDYTSGTERMLII